MAMHAFLLMSFSFYTIPPQRKLGIRTPRIRQGRKQTGVDAKVCAYHGTKSRRSFGPLGHFYFVSSGLNWIELILNWKVNWGTAYADKRGLFVPLPGVSEEQTWWTCSRCLPEITHVHNTRAGYDIWWYITFLLSHGSLRCYVAVSLCWGNQMLARVRTPLHPLTR